MNTLLVLLVVTPKHHEHITRPPSVHPNHIIGLRCYTKPTTLCICFNGSTKSLQKKGDYPQHVRNKLVQLQEKFMNEKRLESS